MCIMYREIQRLSVSPRLENWYSMFGVTFVGFNPRGMLTNSLATFLPFFGGVCFAWFILADATGTICI